VPGACYPNPMRDKYFDLGCEVTKTPYKTSINLNNNIKPE